MRNSDGDFFFATLFSPSTTASPFGNVGDYVFGVMCIPSRSFPFFGKIFSVSTRSHFVRVLLSFLLASLLAGVVYE